MDFASLERSFVELLSLSSPPVAIAFRAQPPAGLRRIARSGPASCSYWSLAAAGDAFFTEAADHQSCPVGAHTHGVPMDAAKAEELQGLVQIMVKLEYLDAGEVPQIPTRKGPFGVAVYAPLAKAPVEPDVVVVKGNARQVMLLAEAARSAGVVADASPMGRPACAILPATMEAGAGHTSLGCIGNRVYTGLADDQLYFAIPGAHLARVAERLAVITGANRALEQLHGERKQKAAATP